jgi:hypothetical protein
MPISIKVAVYAGGHQDHQGQKSVQKQMKIAEQQSQNLFGPCLRMSANAKKNYDLL